MCGRTCLSLNREQLQCACSYKPRGKETFTKPEWLHEHNAGREFSPSYNIAPTDVTPVLLSSNRHQNSAPSDRVLKPMMWGIIPPWHKGDYRTHNLSTNNCRLENITTSKLYSPILRNGGRCVILAEGFYEWQTTDKSAKVKQPYYIYMPQEDGIKMDEPQTWENKYSEEHGWKGISLLYMAGLYNVWQDNETIIYSYSVITMDSNDTMTWLHHRMPAILDAEEQINAWLDIDNVDPKMALSYLKPTKVLSWHEVSTSVNNSRNKSEVCNKKHTIKKNKASQKTLITWFTKPVKRKSDNETTSESKKEKK